MLIKFVSFSAQECIGRVCDLTGCQATDITASLLEQQPSSVTSPLTSETVSIETVDGGVVKSYSGLVSILAAVGVALLAVTVWLVYSMQPTETL